VGIQEAQKPLVDRVGASVGLASFGLRHGPYQSKIFQELFRGLNRLGALANKLITASALRHVDGPGNGIDIDPKIKRVPGSNERPALRQRLDYQYRPG
jgi:hypothetical protein